VIIVSYNENIEWRPYHSVWELTMACNMRCLHCGSYAGKPRGDEISQERALRLVDELVELGLRRITLSGGEPLLRPGWDEIGKRLMDQGVKTGMISNGWYIEENINKFTKAGKWDIVAMSLDGSRKTHDAFRRTPGSFDSILSSFKALKKNGIRTGCITCVSRFNFKELDLIHDVLVSHGVAAWQIQPLFPGGRLRENKDMMIESKELVELAKFIIRKRKVSPMNVFAADGIGYFSKYDSQFRPKGWAKCAAGLWNVGIEANGNIKGCLSLLPEALENNPFVEGNIKTQSLKEIWFDDEKFTYNRKIDLTKATGFCRECEHLNKCHAGCTSVSYFNTGELLNNPYCLHQEIKLNGEPEYETNVPMTDEFREQCSKYYADKSKRGSKKRKAAPVFKTSQCFDCTLKVDI
jgi:radical SAM protein with 4Fe4S-binding SPASM domain